MADIAMCINFKCASRHTCRRYMANIGMRQSYLLKFPEMVEKCEMYWHDYHSRANPAERDELNMRSRSFKAVDD